MENLLGFFFKIILTNYVCFVCVTLHIDVVHQAYSNQHKTGFRKMDFKDLKRLKEKVLAFYEEKKEYCRYTFLVVFSMFAKPKYLVTETLETCSHRGWTKLYNYQMEYAYFDQLM